MKDPKEEKVTPLDTIQPLSSKAETLTDQSLNNASEDSVENDVSDITFHSKPSIDTFTISRIAKKPDEEQHEAGEESSVISLGELLQRARKLDKVSSKISCVEIMLKRELISQEELRKIVEKQGTIKGYFHQIIADMGLIPREEILEIAAEEWGVMKYIDLSSEESVDPEIIKMIPESKARRGLCIPVYKTEKKLSVAMADQ